MAICYIFPQVDLPTYIPFARRFSDSYMNHPPGDTPHSLHVIANGSPIQKRLLPLFEPLPVIHMTHSNFGKDIGAFQMAVQVIPCDLMLFFGAHVHFYYGGWLDRMVDVFLEQGPALYGARAFTQPMPHIRTTAFWCQPQLLLSYPYMVNNDQRYGFEHGQNSIVAHAARMGYQSFMVTRTGVYSQSQWGNVPPGKNLLLDQWSDRHGELE